MGIARPEDADPVPEWIRNRLNDSAILGPDLDRADFAVERKIHQALVHLSVKVVDQMQHPGLIAISVGCRRSKNPFPIFPDIQVISFRRDSVGIHRILDRAVFRQNINIGRVGPEGNGNAGGFADLEVFRRREPFVLDGVDPVIGIGGVWKEFPRKRRETMRSG